MFNLSALNRLIGFFLMNMMMLFHFVQLEIFSFPVSNTVYISFTQLLLTNKKRNKSFADQAKLKTNTNDFHFLQL